MYSLCISIYFSDANQIFLIYFLIRSSGLLRSYPKYNRKHPARNKRSRWGGDRICPNVPDEGTSKTAQLDCESEEEQIRFWEPEGRDQRRFAVGFSHSSAHNRTLSMSCVFFPAQNLPPLFPFLCISLIFGDFVWGAGWPRRGRHQPSKALPCETGKGTIYISTQPIFFIFVFLCFVS